MTLTGSGSDGSTIRGLSIYNFGDSGIKLFDSDGNTIAGNYIGTDATGTATGLGNGRFGIELDQSASNQIGGSTAADRNVIVDNTDEGISLWNAGSTLNVIQGNYIGVDATGNTGLGNHGDGIVIGGGANNNTIGGDRSAGEGNVISGQIGATSDGIEIDNAGADNNKIYGNYIGTNFDGTFAIANERHGVVIYNGVQGTEIGGTGTGQGNIISGNGDSGIVIDGNGLTSTSGNVVVNNLIGVAADGTAALGNAEEGIHVFGSASDNQIGGTSDEGNTIAHGTYGIVVETGSTGISIRRNSIHSNSEIGIDLAAGTTADGGSPNDAGDGDAGGNNLQNWAVLTSASIADDGNFNYELDATTLNAGSYTVDFYASSDRDGGQVEGKRYLGTAFAVSGGGSWAGAIGTVTLNPGEYVTLVTTDASGNSSEFSNYAVATDSDAGGATPSGIQAVASTDGGLTLNNDGGNDVYLEADTSPFTGNDQLTIEVEFSIDSPATDMTTLFSYADSTNQDELFLGIDTDGEIYFRTSENGGTGYGSITNAPQLFDGQNHTVTVTWENSGGVLMFYVDGEQLGLGRNDYQKTTTIDAGGTVVIGQHQNSQGGNFDADDTFSGTIHNVRLFNDLRTEAEITASYQTNLSHDEDGMIAQWSFDNLSTDGVVTETVSGNNLTLRHVTESGFTASEATLTFSIDENPLDGTVVGSVDGVDAEREAQIATLLSANPNLHYSAETGKFYEAVNSTVTWGAAQTASSSTLLNSVGGQLVTIRSAFENDLVNTMRGAAFGINIMWLGAGDFDVEGEWKWYDGAVADDSFWSGDQMGSRVDGAYANWLGTDPNDNGPGEDGARMYDDGMWRDAQDSSNSVYMVEWDADEVLDATQALTYTITSQTVTGAFAIDADTGEITVADGSLLDYETNPTHTVTVRTTDVDSNTYDEAFTISLNDLAESNNAPTALSSGIELNTDGGNDAYLTSTELGTTLGGLSAFTVEATISTTGPDGQPKSLISYATASQSNEIYVSLTSGDGIFVSIAGSSFTTTDTYPELFDGQPNTISVSWDNTNGDVQVYINGKLAHIETNIASGATIDGGVADGTIVLGQDQDSLGGGFESNQIFEGTYYDLRIWDEVRSEAEISLNDQHKFDGGSLPSGLVANWQMDGFNGSNEVVDVVSGNNLSIGHASGAGFIASTPVDDLHISENATDGTSVGFVIPTDPDVTNDIVSDGLFREHTVVGSFEQVSSGNPIGDWTVTKNTAVIFDDPGAYDLTPLGGRSVELGTSAGPASIEQAITTETGRQYQIVFTMSGDWSGGVDAKNVRVSAAGQSADFQMTEPAGWSALNAMWQNRSFTFTADSTSTTLSLESLVENTPDNNVVVGDIRVIEIPAAVTTILNNDPTLDYDAATGKFYRLVTGDFDFTSAQNAASAATVNGVGGQLVTIRSQYENDLVHDYARSINDAVWLGATDSDVESVWRWDEGTAAGDHFSTGSVAENGFYTNWLSGEPNNSTGTDPAGEHFAYMDTSGAWNDIYAAASWQSYVVEWDASEVLRNFTFSLTDDAGGRFAIDANTGEITVADGSQLDYETNTSHDVTIEVTDAAGNSYSQAMTVEVNNLGGEPTQTLPGAQNVDENSSLTFSTGNGNAVSVSDTDGATNIRLQVFLSVNDGILTLSQTTGLSILGGADGSSFMTIHGTESDLNAALEGMTFTPDTNFSGAVNLQMTTSLGADLVGHYTFDAGNAIDDSVGISQNGTLMNNATTVTDGTRGEVLSLDGDDDYVEIASRFSDPANVTVAAWVNIDTSVGSSNGDIISIGDSFILRTTNTGELRIIYYDSGGQNFVDSGVILDSGWHHVAAVFDDVNNQVQLYLDGQSIHIETAANSLVYSRASTTFIGANQNSAAYDVLGLIDDARVYTRALSADELASLAADNTSDTGNVAITVNAVAVNSAPENSIPSLTSSLLPGTIDGPSAVGSGDFDGDGDIDIVAGTLNNTSDASLSWYQNDGSENFTKNTITTGAMTADGIRDLDVADVDGDGDLDIVTVSAGDNRISWWSNDGAGNFTQNIASTSLVSPRSVDVVDFDNDGDLDIIAGGAGGGDTIHWLDNDGSESFTTRTVADIFDADFVTSVQVADVDGDSDLDIVAAAFVGDAFLWFEHQGGGTFVAHTIDSGATVDGAAFVAVADIDGDGDVDVATASNYSDVVSWYKNDGSGNFGAGPEWSVAADGARSILTADLEGDGDIDIIAGSAVDQTIIVHLNDGAATPGFTAQTISSTSSLPLDMHLADIDSDGDVDLIEAAFNEDEVRLYENYGGFQTTADTLEDTPLTFSTAGGNLISISDADAGGAAVQVTLTITNGTITLAQTTGLTITPPADGTDDAMIEFTGTIADINAALDGLVFTPTSDFVGAANLEINTNDLGNTGSGGAKSDVDNVSINVISVNDAPTLGLPVGTTAYTEGAYQRITPSATLTDIDSADFDGGQLTVTIASGAEATDDLYIFTTANILASGVNLSYDFGSGMVLIGSISGGNGVGDPLILDFNANATAAAIQDVIENIYFRANTDDPSTSSRTIDFQLTDGDSGTSTVQSRTIDITAVNDAPVTSITASSPAFTENGGAVGLFNSASVDVVESGDLVSQIVITVDGLANGSDEKLIVDGHVIELTDLNRETTATNSYDVDVTVAGASATVTISKAAGFTEAAAESLLNTLAYNNTSEAVADGARVVTYTSITDDGGGTDTTNNGTASLVTVNGVNDAPAVTTTGSALDFTENDPATVIDAGLTVSDPDTTNLDSVVVRITGNFTSGQDVLAFTDQLGITGNWNAGTGILTLSGSASAADYQTALRTVTYQNTSDDPNTAVRTISFTADDGIDSGIAATCNINITAVNDEQVLSTNTGTTVLEGSTGNIITAAMLETTDVDNTAGQLTYTLTGIPTNGLLRRSGVNLSVSSTFTQADIDAGIITYLHNDTETTSDSFSFTIDDGAGSSSSGTFNITVTPVNDNATTAISDTDVASEVVLENASLGTTIGVTAFASDADAGDTVTYSLDDNDGGRFTIDTNTGIVTVAGAIDREADGASRSITVRATSTDTSFQTRVFSITVNDVDEFDVGPISDNDATGNAVSENAANGTTVGLTALAADLDATNNAITYTLDDDAGGRFAIDGSTGVVTVADGTLLDRESAASHNITVRASSSDGSFNTQLMTINVLDVDEFDVGAVTDVDGATNEVDENAVVGTVVGITASASDADATTNTITYSLQDNDGGRFSIDSSTGIVTVAGAIDREVDGPSRNITVRATSADGSFTDQIFAININDVDEFDVGAVTDTNGTGNEVNENSAIGTVVGITASAADADATTNTIVYSLQDNDGGRFSIESGTGIVRVAGAIDREVDGPTRNITVRATSADGSFTDQIFAININDVDEFDVGVVTDSDAAANAVDENAANGTVVGVTALASDADATNNTITYTLDDNAGGRFAINASTGVVTVADGTLLDREAAASHNITVRAASSDGSFNTQLMTINLDDVDEFDVAPVADIDGAINEVDENAVVGTIVGITADASDADATTNTITYSLQDNDGGRFTIDSSTGVVTVAGSIDREADGASRNITVRATSADGSFTDQIFAININDVDEFDVGIVTDTDGATNEVAENAVVGTTVGITAAADDADATTNGITYSLFDNDGGRFAIDGSTGIVTVADAINREADGPTRNITVRATSADGSFTDQVFAININDVDEFDVGVVTDTDGATNEVAENAVVGTTVGITALASDADATNNTITYTLDDNAGGRFTIDGSTGVVTVADGTLLDREAAASHNITVRATSSDGSFNTAGMTINLNDVDEFDVGAVTDSNATANAVDENAANGTVVGVTALASDADATNNAITYTLDDDAGGRFAIDGSTGVVTVADGTQLDREVAASHDITVRATSSDGSFNTAGMTINILDIDEFDVGPVTDTDGSTDEVTENVIVGTTVGVTADAFDLDATNNTVLYSLTTNPDGLFTIDANTGVVTTAAAIDRETHGATRSITVQAASSDGSVASQSFNITINDVDEFDVGPITDSDGAADTVAENAGIGTSVGITAWASDADATNNAITYTLDDDAGGRFAINGSTGEITVNAALDYESNTSHNVIVRAAGSDGSFNTQGFIISVSDVSESGATPVTDNDGAADSVAENAAIGTTVGVTAFSDDADGSDTISYSLDDNDGGRFAIDSTTGIVTVAAAIDRETDGASRSITVRATSTDGSFQTRIFAISIDDVDEFDVGPVADTDGATNDVDENATNGTVVGVTALASDADATNNTITYTLDDNAGGRFAIDGSTGVVTVADGTQLDREAAASHDITVRATSSDGSFSTAGMTINVLDIDEFDVGPVTDIDGSTDEVTENVVIGTTVGVTADAFDLDATNNAITYSLTSNPDGLFTIDANTGVVTTAAAIDREAHEATRSITVQAASSDGSTQSQTFNIAINDLDEFDVTVPTDSDAATNEVDENVVAGTTVGITADAFDLDATNSTITYSLTSNPDSLFQIDASTGVVTTAAAIDREAHGATRAITVQAQSSDGSTQTQVFNITINDLDEFDVTVPTDSDAATNEVDENAATDTVVGVTALASDADATTDTITYTLDDNAGGRFTIDSSTGVVTVADGTLLDREAAASHDITVRATSADTSFSTAVMTINLNDVDEFDVGAVSDSDVTVNAVNENAANGTVVGVTALAFDADATTNAITYALDDDAGGRFTIDSSTGVVTVADGTLLDREAAASHDITVRATSSDGSFNTAVMTVNLNDVDEFDVGAVSDSDVTANSVAESATVGTAVGITASASDADATTNVITYSLDDDASGLFAIDGSTGAVTVGSALDYETATSHTITVRATSADGSFSTQSFTIDVTDVNESGVTAISDSDATADTVLENATPRTAVGITAFADDADATDSVTYSLASDASGRFAIDANTGIVTVAGAIDREAAGSYDITVRATSTDTSTTSRTFTITIGDVDEYDVGAVTDSDATANAVGENVANGTVVGVTALASDDDATGNTIAYSLDSDAGGRFAIDSSTGVVTVADGTLLDYEAATSHDITVRATSADGSFNTVNMTIGVNDVDEFDVGAVSDTDGTANAVDENATAGTTVGVTASASDADGSNNAITYSLANNDSGRFTIDSSTDIVTVAGAIDREGDGASRTITVRATSADGSFTDQDFTININDVDEFDVGAVSDSDGTANSVDENASVGTVVGVTALASDADATTNTITYSLDNDAGGRFTIDGSTGVVTVADGTLLDREAAASHDLTVRATSTDGSFNTAVMTINVNDVDEFDVSDPTDSDAGTNEVNENVAIGTSVGITADAFDLDATNNTISYSLTSNPEGLFQIDANTGEVTTAAAIDREAHGASRSITVQAQSSDGSAQTNTFNIAINDLDEFDVGAVSDGDGATNEVAENATVGNVVGITASAADADATTNTVTYTLANDDGGRFAIDANTGVVTVAGAIDREADGASRNITVRATSVDGSFTDQVFAININDVDEFDVGVVSDSNATINAVDENAAGGTMVGVTVLASDNDATSNTITYSLDSDAGGRFTIAGSTGVVTVADGTLLDREAAASHNITVRATSADGSFNTAIMTINVNDVDEFDVSVPTDADAASNEVNENVAIGTSVGITADAFDLDATNNTITYSLTSNPDGLFQIDANTGEVTTAAAIDRETHGASRSITVEAASSDGSVQTQTFNLTINDVDEFDVGTVSDSDGTTNGVDENAAVGTAIGVTASASDDDATTNAISYSLADDDGGRFTIDATTGIVTVAGAIDRETDGASRNITIRATSADGSFTDQVLAININDVDEFDVGVVTDSDAAGNAVDENAAGGTVVGVTALASDADATDNTITYTLDDNAGGRFAIDSGTGFVTVADGTLLDYEVATSHNITVRATSSDGSFNTAAMTINVNDVDEFDVGAVSDADATGNAVNENAAIGTAVGITAVASDADATNNTITYSLDDDDGGRFAIDATTGVVTVAGAIDRETDGISRNITVRASSADGSFTDQVLTININDVDEFDVGAVIDNDATGNAVDENAAGGTVVGVTALASDIDATNNTITYTLDDNAGGRFAIDSGTGVVTVANGTLLDFEAATSHNITVRATSSDGSFNTAVMTVNVNDVDEFDVGAVSDVDATGNVVNENAAVGTTVGVTASASDADGSNNTISYSLADDDGGRFAIDANTGVVMVAGGIDREADGASRTITVRATSADGSFTDQNFTINVNDVDEFDATATVDSDAAANQVNENAAIGTTVGITAVASDADATNNTITYSLDDNDGGRFAIDATTGVVTVSGTIDREADGASRSITVRSASSDGSFTTTTLTIAIGDVNEFGVGAPIDSDASANFVNENSALGTSVGLTAFAADADATAVVSYSLDDSVGGRFAIDGSSGVVTVSGGLDFEASASHNVTVRATSSDGSSATQVFTINIGNVNEAPSASGDAYEVFAGTTLSTGVPGVITNDVDIDGDSLTTILVAPPSNGILMLGADGSLSYTPVDGFIGVDSFFYQVSDGVLSSNVVEVQVTVLGSTVIEPDEPEPEPELDDAPEPEAEPDSEPEQDVESEAAEEPMEDPGAPTVQTVMAPPSLARFADFDSDPESQRMSLDQKDDLSVEAAFRALFGDDSKLTSTSQRYSPQVEMLERLLQIDLEQAIVWQAWDQMRDAAEQSPIHYIIGTAGSAAGMFSVGYVVWALRGGAFVTAMTSVLPTWRLVDPASLLTAYRNARSPSDAVENMLG